MRIRFHKEDDFLEVEAIITKTANGWFTADKGGDKACRLAGQDGETEMQSDWTEAHLSKLSYKRSSIT